MLKLVYLWIVIQGKLFVFLSFNDKSDIIGNHIDHSCLLLFFISAVRLHLITTILLSVKLRMVTKQDIVIYYSLRQV